MEVKKQIVNYKTFTEEFNEEEKKEQLLSNADENKTNAESTITRKENIESTKLTTYHMEDYTQSNYYFIKLFLRWKKHFLIVTIIAVVFSAVFSSEFFIQPKYKSFAIIYPSNIIPYSSESPSEQMLQLFQSADIRNSIVKKFKLTEHYGIDTTQKGGISKLIATYEANIEVSRTQFESIEIKVLDTDPKMASEMVTEIIYSLNLKARNLQRSKTKEVEIIVKNQLVLKERQVDSINSKLQELRMKYHLLDYDVQVKEVTKGYIKALGSGKSSSGAKDIGSMMLNLEEKGGEYYQMKKTFDAVLGSYNATKLEYDNVLKDLNKELTYTNIVTKPLISDKKSYPIRWLIVLASVASVNLILFIILFVLDIRNKIFS